MSDSERQKLRKSWREKARRYLQKKKEAAKNAATEKEKKDCDGRKKAGQIKRRRNTEALKKRIKHLEEQLKAKQKTINRIKTQNSRLKKKSSSTPEKKVEKLIKNQKVSKDVKKQLIFGEVLKEQIKKNFKTEKNRKKKREFARFISGSVVKRHKFLTYLSKFGSKRAFKKRKITYREKKAIHNKKLVQEFLERDENSRCMPGKKDTVTFKKLKMQKRLLNYTMEKLFGDFEKEHPNRMSYSQFCKFKPFYIKRPNADKRDTCLCEKCENFDLLVQKMHYLKMVTEKNAYEITKSLTCEKYSEACLERKCSLCSEKKIIFLQYDEEEESNYQKWVKKREVIQKKGKAPKKCQKTIKETILAKKKDIVGEFNATLLKYLHHLSNMLHQFKSIKSIKENLQPGDVLIHMDFSENYACKYGREVLIYVRCCIIIF